jgi:hypothetical protein
VFERGPNDARRAVVVARHGGAVPAGLLAVGDPPVARALQQPGDASAA